jgi:hypothetical protein
VRNDDGLGRDDDGGSPAGDRDAPSDNQEKEKQG